ncbi:MAG: phenylalanine--tRNA ligase subunit beta, partial [Parcubacteria group bacterium CG10_big_fil_rev_8_21_14_0_10_41_35]
MNLPISWLKQFVNIKASPQEIAERLTLSGSEVEKIVDNSMGLSKIVIGQIKSIEPHPDADNLQIAHVDVCSAIGSANGRRPLLKVADRSR